MLSTFKKRNNEKTQYYGVVVFPTDPDKHNQRSYLTVVLSINNKAQILDLN